MSHDGRAHPTQRGDLRWDPGARYRPSVLAGRVTSSQAPAPTARLTGRLRRGPVRRTAVFDRALWSRGRGGVRPGVAEAVAVAAARYRHGALDTTGLVRAVGRALAS